MRQNASKGGKYLNESGTGIQWKSDLYVAVALPRHDMRLTLSALLDKHIKHFATSVDEF